MFVFLLLIFGISAGVLWMRGFWNNVLTFVNLMFAGLLAMNFYEPLAQMADDAQPSFTYLIDFLVFWLLFAVCFGVLQEATNALSKSWVSFDKNIELAGRSIMAIWNGFLITCIVCASLHMAPLSKTPFGGFTDPQEGSFVGMAPDRMWLAFVQSRSRGALSRSYHSGPQHPGDVEMNIQPFDPFGDWTLRHYSRRSKLETMDGLKVGDGAAPAEEPAE